ncbi:helix-turn-helix domain-containing protein [candidate division KSB1 bacterium]|nr:helix-turn-helix domain-containing protein [candidate division KSB1 bacterium]
MKEYKLFGDYFKTLRMKTGLTLRQFALGNNFDPGNISKIERGILSPPQSREKLETYAAALNLKEGSDDWYTFFDYAAACSGKIPKDVMDDAELVKKLPLVFRTLRGEKLTDEQLNTLAKLIRRA